MVVPAGVGRLGTATQVRLVHHVVVVERGEVGQLDDTCGGHHAVGVGITGLCGQQHQQRPEPLAPGLEQVPGGLGDEPGLALDVAPERYLHLIHLVAEAAFELRIEDLEGQGGLHLTNTPTPPRTSISAPGTMPSSRVAATPTAITVPVRALGVVTLGPSPIGSAKNISTITLT